MVRAGASTAESHLVEWKESWRDEYSSGTPIQIRVYREELRIWNPGELPPTWTADRLLQPHESRPPNPGIANTFFRAGFIEAWGRGYEKIRDACREAGTPEPSVEFDGGVRLVWRWEVPGGDEQVDPSQRSGASTGATEVIAEVTTEVDRLALVLSGEMTRRELQTALGLTNDEHFCRAYLLPALGAGAIETTIPGKPNSRLQRYRLTAAGQARLAARTRGTT